MVDEAKVVEMKEGVKEKKDEVKSSEKDTILKEYEDTLGY